MPSDSGAALEAGVYPPGAKEGGWARALSTMMTAYGRTHQGLVRPDNQDHFLARQLDRGAWLVAVADGMGGAPGGREASQRALELVDGAIDGRTRTMVELEQIIARVNRVLNAWPRREPRLLGMGTTLTLAQVSLGEIALVHVGDSRGYRFRAGRLERLTRDHAVAAELLAAGHITEAEAATHPQRHVLTRVLGPWDNVRLDLLMVPRLPGDRLLVCTDGLHGVLREEEIQGILRVTHGMEAVERLIDEALTRGGPDNVTVVLVEEDGNADGR
jgi:serine/threonine protein phosphatase PrpC